MKGYNQLNLEERTIIWRMHEKGESLRCIAQELGRAASTICRELMRKSFVVYSGEERIKKRNRECQKYRY